MVKNEAKIKFTVEAQSFNVIIKQSEENLKMMRAALRENASEMKLNGETQEGLTKKLNILSSELSFAKQKTEMVSEKLKLAKQIFGENSTEVHNLEVKLTGCRTVENGIQADITKTTNALERQADSTKEAESEIGRLSGTIKENQANVDRMETAYKNAVLQYGKTSSEAKQLESGLSSANAELQKNKKRMQEADQAAAELSGAFDKVEKSADDVGTGIEDIFIGSVLADFASNAVGAVAGLEEETREYRNEQAKLAAIAKTSGQSLDGLKTNYTDLFAITGDETLSSTAVANMTALGLSTSDNSKLVNAATGIWAKYGDSIPLDGLMESVNETAKVKEVTGNLADALNWAGINEEEFNEKLGKCRNEQERQKLIIETLNGKYGGLAESYKETNSSVIEANTATAKMTESQAKLAEQIAPVQATLTRIAADGLGFLADNIGVITPLLIGLGTTFTALKIATNASAIATKAAALAQTGFNAVMNANPIVIVIAVIGLLVTAFITLWNNCESFRNFFTGMWTNLQTITSTAINGIKSIFTSGWNSIKNIASTTINGIKSVFTSGWNSIKNIASTALNGIKSIFTSVWNAIKTIVTGVITIIAVIIGTQLQIIKTVVSAVFNAIRSITSTVWNGIKGIITTIITVIVASVKSNFNIIRNFIKTVFNAIRSITSTIWNGIKSKIISPVVSTVSTVKSKFNSMKQTAISIFNGIKSSATSIFNKVKSAITKPVEAAKNAVKRIVNTIKGFFHFSWSLPKLKVPKFAISPPGWKVSDLLKGKIPHLSVAWHAKGGVFTKPTLINSENGIHGVGEAGAEAILPLTTLKSYIETSLVSVLSGFYHEIDYDRLAAACAKMKIILKMNRRELARA